MLTREATKRARLIAQVGCAVAVGGVVWLAVFVPGGVFAHKGPERVERNGDAVSGGNSEQEVAAAIDVHRAGSVLRRLGPERQETPTHEVVGDEPDVEQKPEQSVVRDTSWTFQGAILSPTVNRAMVTTRDGRRRFVREGESLDGVTLVEVGADHIVVRQASGQKKRITRQEVPTELAASMARRSSNESTPTMASEMLGQNEEVRTRGSGQFNGRSGRERQLTDDQQRARVRYLLQRNPDIAVEELMSQGPLQGIDENLVYEVYKEVQAEREQHESQLERARGRVR